MLTVHCLVSSPVPFLAGHSLPGCSARPGWRQGQHGAGAGGGGAAALEAAGAGAKEDGVRPAQDAELGPGTPGHSGAGMEPPALPDPPSPEGAAAPKASLVVSPALPLPSHGAPGLWLPWDSISPPQQGQGLEAECCELAESSWDKNGGRIWMWDKLCDVSPGCSSHLLLQYALMVLGHCGAEPHRNSTGTKWRGFLPVHTAASAYPDVNGEISIPLESVQVYTSIIETAACFWAFEYHKTC